MPKEVRNNEAWDRGPNFSSIVYFPSGGLATVVSTIFLADGVLEDPDNRVDDARDTTHKHYHDQDAQEILQRFIDLVRGHNHLAQGAGTDEVGGSRDHVGNEKYGSDFYDTYLPLR